MILYTSPTEMWETYQLHKCSMKKIDESNNYQEVKCIPPRNIWGHPLLGKLQKLLYSVYLEIITDIWALLNFLLIKIFCLPIGGPIFSHFLMQERQLREYYDITMYILSCVSEFQIFLIPTITACENIWPMFKELEKGKNNSDCDGPVPSPKS